AGELGDLGRGRLDAGGGADHDREEADEDDHDDLRTCPEPHPDDEERCDRDLRDRVQRDQGGVDGELERARVGDRDRTRDRDRDRQCEPEERLPEGRLEVAREDASLVDHLLPHLEGGGDDVRGPVEDDRRQPPGPDEGDERQRREQDTHGDRAEAASRCGVDLRGGGAAHARTVAASVSGKRAPTSTLSAWASASMAATMASACSSIRAVGPMTTSAPSSFPAASTTGAANPAIPSWISSRWRAQPFRRTSATSASSASTSTTVCGVICSSGFSVSSSRSRSSSNCAR